MSLDEIQDQIVTDFALLEGDPEMTVLYIMELGQKLPDMPAADKTDENMVKGCQSKVWLTTSLDDHKMYFAADSNTAITKGLISLLIRIYNGKTPDEILNSELFFTSKIGMDRFIGTQRSNGLAAMIRQMKYYALAMKSKLEVK